MLERSYRLLAAQEGFYYGHELRDNKADFNVAEYVVIEGEFDVDRFYQANKSVLADIETLSFVFRSHDGHGRQQHLPRPVKLELVDLRGLSTGFEIALSQMTVDSAKPFDITNDVLYRQCLYRISDSCQLWYFCSHHLVLDAFAMLQVLSRVAKAYRSVGAVVIDRTASNFSAVVSAEDAYLESATYALNYDYWQHQVSLLPEPTSLSPKPQHAGECLRFSCEEPVPTGWFGLMAEKVDWPSRLITSLLVYLWMMSGNRRQVIGIPMLARKAPAEWAVPACRVNVLPLSVELCAEASVEQTLAAVSDRLSQLKRHQQYPAGALSSGLQSLPFNTVLNILPFTPHVMFDIQQESEVRNIRAGAVNDIAFTVRPDLAGSRLHVTVDANGRLYSASDLQMHVSGLLNVVRTLMAQPQIHLSALPRPRPMAWLEGARACARQDVLSSIFDRAQNQGKQVALTDICNPQENWQSITYQVLVDEVERLAHSLRECAAFDLLVLDLPRSSDSILFMLIALRLGVPFVVLNPMRAQQMLEVLVQHATHALLVARQEVSSDSAGWQESAQYLQIKGYEALRFTRLQGEGTSGFGALAYLMFTSGTAGKAKAVKISRQAMDAFVGTAVNRYGFDTTDVVLNFSEHFFDACIEEIFGALTAGARLVIRPADAHRSTRHFLSFCAMQAITVLDLPTAYWHEMAIAMDAHMMKRTRVRLVVIGGERVSEQALYHWFEKVGDSPQLFNSYGPTEATVVATCALLDKAEGASIGRPLAGVQCAILGPGLTLLPQGASGELLLFGDTLAEGYLGDAERTTERFVEICIDGKMRRGYRTGDLALLGRDNQLHYMGRLDHEVKIAGQRLNLSELEALIEACAGVREVCVVLQESIFPRSLSAHIYGDPALEQTVRRDLGSQIAPEFLPRSYHWHASPLPKTFSGKIDRAQLQRHGKKTPPLSLPKIVERQGWLEQHVRMIWCESLGSNEALDFFQQGGDSLMALRMVNRLNAELGLALTMETVFDSKTLKGLLAYIVREITKLGLQVDCLELRNALLKPPSPVQWSARRTVFLEAHPLHHFADLQGLAEKLDLYLVVSRNDDAQPVGKDCSVQDRLYWHDVQGGLWHQGQAWPVTQIPAVQYAIFIMPHRPEAYPAWSQRCLERLRQLQMHNLERALIVTDREGRRWFEKHILSAAECKRLEFHTCSPHALQERQHQEELIVDWSVRIGYFPDLNLPPCFVSMRNLLAELAGRPGRVRMSVRDRLFARAQSFNPDVKVCSFAQWLKEITRYSGSPCHRLEQRTVYRLNL